MTGQMCWIAKFGTDGRLVLHLRLGPFDPWKPYTLFPNLMVPDYPIAGASKGWATCQKLMTAGWQLLPTAA